MEEKLIIPNIHQTYIECTRRAIVALQKIDVILHKLSKANRRQKDLMNRDLELLYSAIRKEVEAVVKIRRVQTEATIEAFDRLVAEKAKPVASDEPEVYFAKRVAEAIADEASFKPVRRKK